jgi:hypothetical protein
MTALPGLQVDNSINPNARDTVVQPSCVKRKSRLIRSMSRDRVDQAVG